MNLDSDTLDDLACVFAAAAVERLMKEGLEGAAGEGNRQQLQEGLRTVQTSPDAPKKYERE